jgi:hypothetical protein
MPIVQGVVKNRRAESLMPQPPAAALSSRHDRRRRPVAG